MNHSKYKEQTHGVQLPIHLLSTEVTEIRVGANKLNGAFLQVYFTLDEYYYTGSIFRWSGPSLALTTTPENRRTYTDKPFLQPGHTCIIAIQ